MKKKIMACALAGAVALSSTPAALADSDSGSSKIDETFAKSVLSGTKIKDSDELTGYFKFFKKVEDVDDWLPWALLAGVAYLSYQIQVQQGMTAPFLGNI